MTYYHAEAGGHKLRVLTHEQDLPVVVKLSCGAVAGAIAQTGGFYYTTFFGYQHDQRHLQDPEKLSINNKNTQKQKTTKHGIS